MYARRQLTFQRTRTQNGGTKRTPEYCGYSCHPMPSLRLATFNITRSAKRFPALLEWRQTWERNAGMRLDHILLSTSLAAGLRDAGSDTWVRGLPGTSDHAPAWVKMETAR